MVSAGKKRRSTPKLGRQRSSEELDYKIKDDLRSKRNLFHQEGDVDMVNYLVFFFICFTIFNFFFFFFFFFFP